MEAVDPVVLGKARATMTYKGDKHGKTSNLSEQELNDLLNYVMSL